MVSRQVVLFAVVDRARGYAVLPILIGVVGKLCERLHALAGDGHARLHRRRVDFFPGQRVALKRLVDVVLDPLDLAGHAAEHDRQLLEQRDGLSTHSIELVRLLCT